jgi:hypothetical protein
MAPWHCDGDRGPNAYRYAKQVMIAMGSIDIPASIEFFQEHGGFCDCEILLNVDSGQGAPPEPVGGSTLH